MGSEEVFEAEVAEEAAPVAEEAASVVEPEGGEGMDAEMGEGGR